MAQMLADTPTTVDAPMSAVAASLVSAAVAAQHVVDNGTYEPGFSRYTNQGSAINVRVDATVGTAPLVGSPLAIPTGVGTGDDIVEPMVLFDATAPFLGYEYVLVAAPYYQSNAVYENPCLWVSHDGTTWTPVVNGVPTVGGTVTPVVASAVQGDANNSDPYIVRAPNGTYYILWNQQLNATGIGGTGTGGNNWSVKGVSASSLAGPWTTPVTLFTTILATDRPFSPSIFWDGHQWVMYCVNGANTSATLITKYLSPSASPLAATWTKQANPAIAVPAAYATRVWWHLNAYRFGTQHVLLIQDNVAGSSAGGNLWLVTSDDGGATFTVPAAPVLITNAGYRGAIIPMASGKGLTLDLFYGFLTTTWQLRRTVVSFPVPVVLPTTVKYGGVNDFGLPYVAAAVLAAKVPLAPYVFGDTARRADSAVTPGTADSGQAYVVTAGTAGISSNQLYAVTAANTRAGVAVAGAADGVAVGEFSVMDCPASHQWLITRYLDGNNYVRFGYNTGTTTWILQNIVAAAVTQTGTASTPALPGPANGDVVAIVCSGSTITAYVNGLVAATATGWTSNQTNSGTGFQTGSLNTRTRNLTLRALVSGI